ncbi:3379_t:CDS:10, partial [Entrophospora sp. SA101]
VVHDKENLSPYSSDNDDETNLDIINNDNIVSEQLSMTILKSKLYLEKIWVEVINHLKKAKIQVQVVHDKENLSPYSSDNDDETNLDIINNDNIVSEQRSVEGLNEWKSKFLNIENEDAKLAIKLISFYQKALNKLVNLFQTSTRERDILINIVAPLLSKTLNQFNICEFSLYWYVACIPSTNYTNLTNDYQKFDCIAEIRNFGLELLLLEAGDDKTDIYGRKYHNDHSQLKIALKDCLDMFMEWLHLSTAEISEICTLGLQIIDTKWIIYSMTYDPLSKYYFFHQLCSFHFPTSFSDLEFFLPYLIENLLSLRHTMLNMVNKTKEVTIAARTTTPSPQSSPLHETPETPPQIK